MISIQTLSACTQLFPAQFGKNGSNLLGMLNRLVACGVNMQDFKYIPLARKLHKGVYGVPGTA